MKKLVFISFIAFVVLSCSDETYDATNLQQEAVSTSSIRSYDEALAIAQKAMTLVLPAETRGEETHIRTIDLAKSHKCIKAAATRGGGSSVNDTLMYVFNFADDEGFAIISANPDCDPVLAVTESGNYDPDEASDIDGFNDFVSLATFYVLNTDKLLDSMTVQKMTYTTYTPDTAILRRHGAQVPVAWGEIDPEGIYCPNGRAGCANTAIAQIMSYYEYPTEIVLSCKGNSSTTLQLDWDNLIDHKIGHSYTTETCTVSEENHQAIGWLCRELGYRNNSSYTDSEGTIADLAVVPYTLKNLGFTVIGYDTLSVSDITDYIDKDYKIFMYGYPKNGSYHAWVVDQYADVIITEEVSGGLCSYWQGNFIHINWGWYGQSNGYFNGRVFKPAKVYEPDYGTYHSDSYNYVKNLKTLKIKKS